MKTQYELEQENQDLRRQLMMADQVVQSQMVQIDSLKAQNMALWQAVRGNPKDALLNYATALLNGGGDAIN